MKDLTLCSTCGSDGDNLIVNCDKNDIFWVECSFCGEHSAQCKTEEGAVENWVEHMDYLHWLYCHSC